MAISKEDIAIIKGMLEWRSYPGGKSYRQQEIAGHFKINSARVTEIRYGDKGVGVGIAPADQSKFPKECRNWPLIRPSADRRKDKSKKRKLLANGAIELAEINKKFKPLIKALKAESQKDIATISFSRLMHLAWQLEKCLEEWNTFPKKFNGESRHERVV